MILITSSCRRQWKPIYVIFEELLVELYWTVVQTRGVEWTSAAANQEATAQLGNILICFTILFRKVRL